MNYRFLFTVSRNNESETRQAITTDLGFYNVNKPHLESQGYEVTILKQEEVT